MVKALKAKSEIMQKVRKCDWFKNRKLFQISLWEIREKSKN